MGFSTPSTGIACGASPLTLASARHGALFTGRPPMWGHSSRCFAFGGVYGDTPLAALPSEGCMGTLLSPLCLRRGAWGHSSRSFAFGGVRGDTPLLLCLRRGVPIIFGQRGSDCIPIVFPTRGKRSLRSFFPSREKRSLIPPCAPSTASRNCTNCRQFRH